MEKPSTSGRLSDERLPSGHGGYTTRARTRQANAPPTSKGKPACHSAEASGSASQTVAGPSARRPARTRLPPPLPQHCDASTSAAADAAPHFDDLPSAALAIVFDALSMRDLGAAACTCRVWRLEADNDRRWQVFWHEGGRREGRLWRWAAAAGGYREQLRSSHSVRTGAFVVEELPLPRHDGPVKEVLLLLDEDNRKRIITIHSKPTITWPAVRLCGDTLKLWDCDGLRRRTPLMVVHDLLRNPTQLDDGCLVMWRVRDNEVISKVAESFSASNSGDASGSGAPPAKRGRYARAVAEVSAARRAPWAEHPGIVVSVLNPLKATLVDLPLQATLGKDASPHEWLDIVGGVLASVHFDNVTQKLAADLYDRLTGVRLARSEVRDLYEPAAGVEVVPRLTEPLVLAAATGWMRTGGRLLLSACLFDAHIYCWALDEFFDPTFRAAMNQPGAVPPCLSSVAAPLPAEAPDEWPPALMLQPQHLAAAPAVSTDAEGGLPMPVAGGTARPRGLYRLATMPYSEPIGDLSVSFPERHIYVVGVQNFYVLALDGTFLAYLNMSAWVPPFDVFAPLVEVGGFCWPVPHSQLVAVHLNTANAFFLVDLSAPVSTTALQGDEPLGSSLNPGFRRVVDDHGVVALMPSRWRVKSFHLRSSPTASVTQSRFRLTSYEPTAMEYTQCGEFLFACGDPRQRHTQLLLHPNVPYTGRQLQRDGTGSSEPPKLWSRPTARSGQRSRSMADAANALPASALMMIQTKTGKCFGAVPLSGVQESLHCAGGVLAAAIGPPKGTPATSDGRLLLFDFVEGAHQLRKARTGGHASGCGAKA